MSEFKKDTIKILRGLFVLLLVGFLIKYSFDGFMQKGMTEIVASSEIVTNLFSEFGIDSYHVEKVLNDEIIKDFFKDVSEGFIYDFSKGEVIKNKNLVLKIKTFIVDNRRHLEDIIGYKLYDSFIDSLDTQPALLELESKYNEVISYSHDYIPDYGKNILSVLIGLSNFSYSLINLLIMFVVVLIIMILQWNNFEWLSSIGGNVIGCGIFMFIITCLINYFMNAILLYLPVQMSFDFMRMFYTSIVTLVIGIICKVVYIVLNKIKERKDLINLEVS